MTSINTKRMDFHQSLWDCVGDAHDGVLEHLSHSDLQALCRVSKDSRAFSERVLYSKVEWTWPDNAEDSKHPLAGFLRTVLRRPELALHVRSVSLLGNNHTYDTPYHEISPSSPSPETISFPDEEVNEHGPVVQAIGCYPTLFRPREVSSAALPLAEAEDAIGSEMPYAEQWKKDLRHGWMDGFVTLLLSQLHNLASLTLGPDYTRRTCLLGMLLISSSHADHRWRFSYFHRLRQVTLQNNWEPFFGAVNSTADLLPFFYLRSVRHLSASLKHPVKLEWPAPPPDLCLLTRLNLTNIRGLLLGDLLSATRALRSLQWRYVCEPELCNSSARKMVDLDEIMTGLSPTRETLQELYIVPEIHDFHGNSKPQDLDYRGSLNNLANFSQLDTLELPLAFLVGHNGDIAARLETTIPRHIQLLTLSDIPYTCYVFDDEDDSEGIQQAEWDNVAVLSAIDTWLGTTLLRSSLSKITILLQNPCQLPDPGLEMKAAELTIQYRIKIEISLAPIGMLGMANCSNQNKIRQWNNLI